MRVVDCEWSGVPAHLVVVLDISERKRLDRLKDEFVATVSHELRTPLTSISGSLGLLMGGAVDKLPDPILRLITIAHNNCQRLVRLINDILDVEKIESGESPFDLKQVELRTLVEQVIEANRGFAQIHDVGIRLDATCPAIEVHADPDRLAQVVTNLLSNAIKFSPPGEEVTVTIGIANEAVRIGVRNRGREIPEDFKPHVFERFAQADVSDARSKGGTGLGLSIVRQIVTRLGGKVTFEDAHGGGTLFLVDLPRLKPDAAEPERLPLMTTCLP
jgi:signal transduction histidine kinase